METIHESRKVEILPLLRQLVPICPYSYGKPREIAVVEKYSSSVKQSRGIRASASVAVCSFADKIVSRY
jgi:hypothetical protein